MVANVKNNKYKKIKILLIFLLLTGIAYAGTVQDIGTITFYNFNDGTDATSQRIGTVTYVTSSDGSQGTVQQIGNIKYFESSGDNKRVEDIIIFTPKRKNPVVKQGLILKD